MRIAVTPRAVDALLDYAEAEARGIIEQNADIVAALAAELIERGTLLTNDIQRIVDIEVARRSEWCERKDAGTFLAMGGGLARLAERHLAHPPRRVKPSLETDRQLLRGLGGPHALMSTKQEVGSWVLGNHR